MRLILLAICFLSAPAFAGDLPEVPDPVEETLPIDRDEGDINCPEIVERLEKYNKMARQHDQSVTSFLGQVSGRLNEWHGQLKPLEGKQQKIEEGTFDVLSSGASKVDNITNVAYDNSELLAIEMDRIIVSLRDCAGKR